MMQLVQILANTTENAEESAAGIAALGIDPWAILAQAATFLLLFFIIKKFALEKIVSSLEERRKTIDQGVHLGYKMAEEQAKLEEKIEAELHKTREKADVILAEAQKDAGDLIRAAEDAATQKVDAMLADAHVRIDEDMNKAKLELEKELLGLVADATEAVIGERLDAQKDEALLRRALTGGRR